MSTTYNGWTNYQTWVTKLWLDNEPGTSEDMTRLTKRRRDSAVSVHGDVIREYVQEAYQLPTSGLAADLIGSALDLVNWVEIAEAYREDAEDEE